MPLRVRVVLAVSVAVALLLAASCIKRRTEMHAMPTPVMVPPDVIECAGFTIQDTTFTMTTTADSIVITPGNARRPNPNPPGTRITWPDSAVRQNTQFTVRELLDSTRRRVAGVHIDSPQGDVHFEFPVRLRISYHGCPVVAGKRRYIVISPFSSPGYIGGFDKDNYVEALVEHFSDYAIAE